jgi:hypothetical protein
VPRVASPTWFRVVPSCGRPGALGANGTRGPDERMGVPYQEYAMSSWARRLHHADSLKARARVKQSPPNDNRTFEDLGHPTC